MMRTVGPALEDRATIGMRSFLKTLSRLDLYAIAKTTTGGLIAPSSDEDAISIITKYSDAVSLLNRRRIRKDDMAKYLHKENVAIQLPTDKTKLCRYVLHHWGLSDSQTENYTFQEDENGSNSADDYRRQQRREWNDPNSRLNRPSAAGHSSNPTYFAQSSSTSADISNPAYFARPGSSTTGNYSNPNVSNFAQTNFASSVPSTNIVPMSTEAVFQQSQQQRQYQQTGQELGTQFAAWFYPKWNKLEDFTAAHFWPQCNLRVEVIQPGAETTVKEIYQNGEECCAFMRLLVQEEELWMNPNLLDGLGVWGKINPHGLAQIIVCGTAHKNKRHFGIFEQVFGLVKDPNCENNFKIQFSVIRFRGMGGMLEGAMPTNPPAIRDSSLACMIEELPDE